MHLLVMLCCCCHITVVACAGFAGYSAYAPTKWAVRGLADTLRNEVGVICSYGTSMCCFPTFRLTAVCRACSTAPCLCLWENTQDNIVGQRSSTFWTPEFTEKLFEPALLEVIERSCKSAWHAVMQLQGSGVSVSVGFPADMRGASYAQEELIKV